MLPSGNADVIYLQGEKRIKENLGLKNNLYHIQVLRHLSRKLETKGGSSFWIFQISGYRVNRVL